MSLSDLPNIGKTLEKELNGIGIHTYEELKSIGSVEAIKRLELHGPTCYNKLYAIEGAIREIRWHSISKDDREALKKAFENE